MNNDTIPGIQRNIVSSVTSSAEDIEKWKTMPELNPASS